MMRLISFGLACIAVLGLAGCGGGDSASSGGTGAGGGERQILRVGNGAEPKDLDPQITTGVPEHMAQLSLFEGLVVLNPYTLEPEPGAAESWIISDDKRVYTFKLQPEGRWSNGDPVTARDFAYSYKRMLTPTFAADYAYMLHCVKNAKAYNLGQITDFEQVGVKALDETTLEITLENPTPYFLAVQIHNSFFPVHQAAVEAHGKMDERGTPWTRAGNLVGNGAYMLAEWSPDEVIRVVRNPNYWRADKVKLDEIDFYPINVLQTEERMFQAGELDLTENIPLHKIKTYKEEHPELIHLDPWLGVYFYRFNTTRKPFNDERVRKAFSMAIDRETMAKSVLKGGEQPAYQFTPPNMGGYKADPGVTYDVEGARKLLAEAGYPDGKGMPPVDILYNTVEQHKTIAEAVQAMWKNNLNVEVTLSNQDWKVYQENEKNLNYSISRAGWIADFADPVNFLECFLTNGGNNRTGWGSPAYDFLINHSYKEPNPDARLALLAQAERTFMDAAPVAPLYFYTIKYLKATNVQHLPANTLRYRRWDMVYLGDPPQAEHN